LDYFVRAEIAVKPEAEDPPDNYETVDQEMTARAPHTGRPFVNDRCKVWDIMSNLCGKHSCFVYIKPALRTRNGRDAYMLLFDNRARRLLPEDSSDHDNISYHGSSSSVTVTFSVDFQNQLPSCSQCHCDCFALSI
jgi:hypothetical protein